MNTSTLAIAYLAFMAFVGGGTMVILWKAILDTEKIRKENEHGSEKRVGLKNPVGERNRRVGAARSARDTEPGGRGR